MSTDEYGETPTFYIWPANHEEGEPLPENFYRDLYATLRAAGYGCESV